jgi:hypothetical protein
MRSVRVMFTIYVALIVAGLVYAIALGILEH